jgi:hypothetical protein
VRHDIVEPKTGSKKKLVKQLDRDVQVCGIFLCFSKHSLLWDSPLAFILEGVHAFFFLFLFLCSLIGAHFSMLLEHILFFWWPLSPFARSQKRNLFVLWSIYFWWMDDMFCVTPGVGVSMYMWVYVISIMEAWKDSTKGHNNSAKLNGSQESICWRFDHWYRHMALVGNKTIEELALFYFQKEIIWDFTILWDRAD